MKKKTVHPRKFAGNRVVDGKFVGRVSRLRCANCMDPKLVAVLRRMLKYSLHEIDYDYTWLTGAEKRICSPEEHKLVVAFVKGR